MWKLYAGLGFVLAGVTMIIFSSSINIGRIFEFQLIQP